MSTLTFLRKFALRMSLGLSILALPQIAYATQQEGDDDPPGHHSGVKHDDDGGGSLNLHISDETLNHLLDVVSGLQFNGSCSNTGGTSLTSLVNAL